jgi:two-component system, cell cycle sensor histidine kinase and response regulator CckA
MATILIVDNEATSRAFMVTPLRHQGHRLVEAANGREGLDAVRAHRPDLVITDVLMPVMDGYEFVKQLRLDPATRTIPVVVSTSYYGEREATALALSGGVADVLTKPVKSAEVLQIVGRVLSGESETKMLPDTSPATIDPDQIRSLSDELAATVNELNLTNGRLRAVVEIGLTLASERDSDRRLQSVCTAARDLFGATYATLGTVDLDDRTVLRLVTSGLDATDWMQIGDSVSGVLGTVLSGRRPVRADNPGGDPIRLHLPARHPEVQAFLATAIASPGHVYGWICLVRNDGRSFTEDDEHLIEGLSAQVGRIYELEHEVLERQLVESSLRHERNRAQGYLDMADVILVALDMDGRITLINRKGCDLLGRTKQELVGRNPIETCVPDRVREFTQKKLPTLLAGDLPVMENPIVSRSGEERLIEWRNTMLHDDNGHVIGTLSSGNDITERTRTLEAVRTAEERMRFALQSADVGIWDMDYATGVLRWSATLEAHYGLQRGTFGGTLAAFVERIHPEDRGAVLETLENAKRTGNDFSIPHRSLWPDGTVRWLNCDGRIHLENGEPLRGVGISLDVTERRTLEEQYQQAQKMEAIGRLAGGVAHDFNNLLTVILGYCDLVLDELDPDDPRQVDMSEIKRAGASATGLTRQLLAFSRKEIIEPTLLDLNVVVAEMRAMLGRLIEEDVNVVLGLPTELALIKADRGQVEQIVMNLALNARDAMPGGGTLTIATANVDLDEQYARTHLDVTPGPYVMLTVTDTGTGMTPQVQARVFEPFFTTKEAGTGTGLGLATVHGIAARNGGSVHVLSEVGRGTSFQVYFPRANADEAAINTPPPVTRSRAGGQTVLIVEDADGLRELARRLLQRQGYTVIVAANADEAFRQFDRHPSIDVLLTDVVMPGLSGPELARQLLERRPSLRTVYMSGYTKEAIVQHGVLDPGIAFLHKPFTSETLGQKIREVLGR